MKKVLSIALALVMVFGLMAGLQASAVKNLMTVTDETANTEWHSGAYVKDLIENNQGQNFSVWIADGGDFKGDAPGSGRFTIDTKLPKVGKQSLKLSNEKVINSCFILEVVGLKKNTSYVYQGYIKSDKITGGTATVSIQSRDTEANQFKYFDSLAAFSDAIEGTKAWTKFAVKFKTPTKDFSCITLEMTLNGKGTVWFDGLALTEGTKAVADGDIQGPSAPAPTPKPTPVPDVPSAWALAEVNAAVAAGIIPTAINSQFRANITRSDFCDLIIKTIEVKKGMTIAAFVATVTGTVEKTFTDTTSANVLAAAKLGIVNGRTETTFVPTAPITRQEATKMLTLAAKVMGADITADPTAFADEAQIAVWAKEFVAYCAKAKIMNGLSETIFSPLGRYTREQSMLTALRLFNAIQ